MDIAGWNARVVSLLSILSQLNENRCDKFTYYDFMTHSLTETVRSIRQQQRAIEELFNKEQTVRHSEEGSKELRSLVHSFQTLVTSLEQQRDTLAKDLSEERLEREMVRRELHNASVQLGMLEHYCNQDTRSYDSCQEKLEELQEMLDIVKEENHALLLDLGHKDRKIGELKEQEKSCRETDKLQQCEHHLKVALQTIEHISDNLQELNERNCSCETLALCDSPLLHDQLIQAVKECRIDCVGQLTGKDVSISQQEDDELGNTAMHWAASTGCHSAVKLFVDRDHSLVHVHNKVHTLPLSSAARGGFVETVQLLLNDGAHVNDKNDVSLQALHHAARTGHSDVARILIKYGADVGARSEDCQRTPLHDAARNGWIDVVHVLLEAGAVRSGRNCKQQTPEDEARYHGYIDIAELLQNSD